MIPARAILHVDMDAFFASVEMLDDPQLVGRPVLVGGSERRGVVAAANYEARKFGCHSAQPMATALRFCPHALVRKPRRERYLEVSRQVFVIFDRYTPLIEPLSIDEAFLDISGTDKLFGSPLTIAKKIRFDIHNELGLTCSVGIASNKLIAKIASEIDKPDGLTEVPVENQNAFLEPLPIGKLWGVGPKSQKILAINNIHTIGQFLKASPDLLHSLLGDHAWSLQQLALGVDHQSVQRAQSVKQISHEDTFEHDRVGSRQISRELQRQALQIADTLVTENLFARTIRIKLRNQNFKTLTRQISIAAPTQAGKKIHKIACQLLSTLSLDPGGYRLVGLAVHVEQSEDHDRSQLCFGFSHDDRFLKESNAEDSLQTAMTAIRQRFGASSLNMAESLLNSAKAPRGKNDSSS